MATAVSDLSPITFTPDILQRGVELVPVPAAHLIRKGGGWDFEAVNRAYRMTGLGNVADRSPMLAMLGERLDGFLASQQLREDFDWSLGDTIDCRFYRVTLARTAIVNGERCAACFVDHTAQVHTERSLRREMTTDSLTGLPNREGFGDLMEEAPSLEGVAVLVIDLARFGRVNACLGGLAGDELLITVARRIKGALRARDRLARIGGDEFGILLEIDQDRDEAHHAAERIGRVLTAPFRLTDYEISVNCSIGIAFGADRAIEGAAGEAEELIRHAQFAVKRAKETGRTEAYETTAFSIARARFGLETELRHAIEDRRLHLAFQPICDLASGRIVAFETLTRWVRDDGFEISPCEFIPAAEESGLIVPLGRWAIEEATRTLARWDRQAGGHCGLQLAVNLSPIQLQRDSVRLLVERALSSSGLTGDRLKLELTESALVADPEGTAATLHALKELGCSIAMDDFGTGYSNLALLQTLPIDLLKIDRSFVTEMLADRDKVAIVRAILGLAQALSMRTVAEGIETVECAQTLAALGCTYGQGFHYARPLDADAAYRMVTQASA